MKQLRQHAADVAAAALPALGLAPSYWDSQSSDLPALVRQVVEQLKVSSCAQHEAGNCTNT